MYVSECLLSLSRDLVFFSHHIRATHQIDFFYFHLHSIPFHSARINLTTLHHNKPHKKTSLSASITLMLYVYPFFFVFSLLSLALFLFLCVLPSIQAFSLTCQTNTRLHAKLHTQSTKRHTHHNHMQLNNNKRTTNECEQNKADNIC